MYKINNDLLLLTHQSFLLTLGDIYQSCLISIIRVNKSLYKTSYFHGNKLDFGIFILIFFYVSILISNI